MLMSTLYLVFCIKNTKKLYVFIFTFIHILKIIKSKTILIQVVLIEKNPLIHTIFNLKLSTILNNRI